MPQRRPEVLAPAGDPAAMRAAIRAGADAVYFGLKGFNARARAHNFDADELSATMKELHASGVRGYVALNTLVFDSELPSLEAAEPYQFSLARTLPRCGSASFTT